MKQLLFLLAIVFVCLPGCADTHLQIQVVASGEINEEYSMNVVSNNKSASNGIQFTSVVLDQQGKEKSSIDISSLFGNEMLDFNENSLRFFDYNGDGDLDIAIGIPEATETGMYRYIVLSIDDSGNQYPLQIEGYKESGYLYSIDAGSCPLLTTTKSVEGRYEISVGIIKNERAVPARYVWDGNKFSFVNEAPYVISKEQIPNHDNTYLAIEQVEFRNPLKPYDEDFDIYKSYMLGNFDAVVYKNNKEVSRLNINDLFAEATIGWAGPFSIIFNDYNSDGMEEFALGQPDEGSADFKYVLITIDSEGMLSRLNAKGFKEEGYIYSSNETPELSIIQEPEIGVSVVLSDGGWKKGTYIWDDAEHSFLFSN